MISVGINKGREKSTDPSPSPRISSLAWRLAKRFRKSPAKPEALDPDEVFEESLYEKFTKFSSPTAFCKIDTTTAVPCFEFGAQTMSAFHKKQSTNLDFDLWSFGSSLDDIPGLEVAIPQGADLQVSPQLSILNKNSYELSPFESFSTLRSGSEDTRPGFFKKLKIWFGLQPLRIDGNETEITANAEYLDNDAIADEETFNDSLHKSPDPETYFPPNSADNQSFRHWVGKASVCISQSAVVPEDVDLFQNTLDKCVTFDGCVQVRQTRSRSRSWLIRPKSMGSHGVKKETKSILKSKVNSNFEKEHSKSLRETNVSLDSFINRFEEIEYNKLLQEELWVKKRQEQVQNYYHNESHKAESTDA